MKRWALVVRDTKSQHLGACFVEAVDAVHAVDKMRTTFKWGGPATITTFREVKAATALPVHLMNRAIGETEWLMLESATADEISQWPAPMPGETATRPPAADDELPNVETDPDEGEPF